MLLSALAWVAEAHPADIFYDYETGWPKVCAEPATSLTFTVSFAALHENSVVILRIDDSIDPNADAPAHAVATFNNYMGKGAGSYWKSAEGGYITAHSHNVECYLIISRHKRVRPSHSEPWISPHFRIHADRSGVGFADFANRDYINAVVGVSQ